MSSRVELLRALQAGSTAGRSGTSLKQCPYAGDDLRRAAWVRGYVTARPAPDITTKQRTP